MAYGVSVYEMFRTIGRAGIATKSGSSVEIANYLRSLSPDQLIEEYHRAVVTLASRGLLSHDERIRVAEYARDWISDQPMGT